VVGKGKKNGEVNVVGDKRRKRLLGSNTGVEIREKGASGFTPLTRKCSKRNHATRRGNPFV